MTLSKAKALGMEFAAPRTIPINGSGPEDIVVDSAGRIYTGLADGRILRITDDGRTIETIARTPDRTLGLELHGDDELIATASARGLLAITISTGAVRPLAESAFGKPMLAVDNCAVAADGTIYFSDSSQVFPVPEYRRDLVERTASGRLLRRDPDGTLTEVLGGLEFAGGVTLARDESYVVVGESGTCRLHRIWLTGAAAGTAEVFADNLWGYPDNLSTDSDGLIWLAIPSRKVAALGIIQRFPAPLRTLTLSLPPQLQPGPSATMGVIALNDTGDIVRSYRGRIPGFHMLTGVRHHQGRLYFGSLTEPAIAIADL
ncbi:SMP-30/gluconolactonase/LRE family protein [Nocardia nepalensis]|uniref:SMP-30/gluconolactonase/LRE family protein n=1 Tax=Nocardia nepalensis TaxID=3375448 RepID=UPI003B6787F1